MDGRQGLFHRELAAPCGMNCGVCAAYLVASRNQPRRRRRPHCAGCRIRPKNCAFLKRGCPELGEGRVQFCFECASFPCRRLKTIDRRYRERYGTILIANLDHIRDHGIDAWLAREAEKWRCPRCGGVISIHDGMCYDCEVSP